MQNDYITYSNINKYEVFSICQGYAFTIRNEENIHSDELFAEDSLLIFLFCGKQQVECVKVRKWVRGILKGPAVYKNDPSIAVATTWTLLTEAQSWVKLPRM